MRAAAARRALRADAAQRRRSSNAVGEAQRLGLATKANFVAANLYLFDFTSATVLTMYLLPHINLDLRPRILGGLKPGTRVVSHDFDMGKWQPDVRLEVPVPDKPYGEPVSRVYLWYVPAHVAGQWQWQIAHDGRDSRIEAAFNQNFQRLTATAVVEGARAEIEGATLKGDAIAFMLKVHAGGRKDVYEFSGRIDGDEMTGKVTTGGDQTSGWRALRIARGRAGIE
jgi:hypothetical protein